MRWHPQNYAIDRLHPPRALPSGLPSPAIRFRAHGRSSAADSQRSPHPSPRESQHPEHERRQRRPPTRAGSQSTKPRPSAGAAPRIGHPASARRPDARGHRRTGHTTSTRPAPCSSNSSPRPAGHCLLAPRRAGKLPPQPHHRLLSAAHPRRGNPHFARRLAGRPRTIRSGPPRRPR